VSLQVPASTTVASTTAASTSAPPAADDTATTAEPTTSATAVALVAPLPVTTTTPTTSTAQRPVALQTLSTTAAVLAARPAAVLPWASMARLPQPQQRQQKPQQTEQASAPEEPATSTRSRGNKRKQPATTMAEEAQSTGPPIVPPVAAARSAPLPPSRRLRAAAAAAEVAVVAADAARGASTSYGRRRAGGREEEVEEQGEGHAGRPRATAEATGRRSCGDGHRLDELETAAEAGGSGGGGGGGGGVRGRCKQPVAATEDVAAAAQPMGRGVSRGKAKVRSASPESPVRRGGRSRAKRSAASVADITAANSALFPDDAPAASALPLKASKRKYQPKHKAKTKANANARTAEVLGQDADDMETNGLTLKEIIQKFGARDKAEAAAVARFARYGTPVRFSTTFCPLHANGRFVVEGAVGVVVRGVALHGMECNLRQRSLNLNLMTTSTV
jgi:ribonuclease E